MILLSIGLDLDLLSLDAFWFAMIVACMAAAITKLIDG